MCVCLPAAHHLMKTSLSSQHMLPNSEKDLNKWASREPTLEIPEIPDFPFSYFLFAREGGYLALQKHMPLLLLFLLHIMLFPSLPFMLGKLLIIILNPAQILPLPLKFPLGTRGNSLLRLLHLHIIQYRIDSMAYIYLLRYLTPQKTWVACRRDFDDHFCYAQ